MGFTPVLKAFIAAVIGGFGSLAGAVVGGYVLGGLEVLLIALPGDWLAARRGAPSSRRVVTFLNTWLPSSLSGYRDAFVFVVLILVLLFRPNGLLGPARPGRDGVRDGDRWSILRRHWLPIVLVAVLALVLVALQASGSGYLQGLAINIGLFMILVVSLNLFNGFTGVFSLGHIGFMALGAYIAAILTLPLGREAEPTCPTCPAGWPASTSISPWGPSRSVSCWPR